MAKRTTRPQKAGGEHSTSATIDELLTAALERGSENFHTGRYVITFSHDAREAASERLTAYGLRVADARDFPDQTVRAESAGDADAVLFPEIGAALISGAVLHERFPSIESQAADDNAIEALEPEYFAFPCAAPAEYLRGSTGGMPLHEAENRATRTGEYLRGFTRAAQLIAGDLQEGTATEIATQIEPGVAGATWGLIACKVPQSARSGAGLKVALINQMIDVGHPGFAGRTVVTRSFAGPSGPIAGDHATHCAGTACGPEAPVRQTPRYGIAFRTQIFVGDVFGSSAVTTTATVLAALNWAIANGCAVIFVGFGASTPVQSAYTAAGAAALNKGCLIVAGAGHTASQTFAPANSPTIMAVASLEPSLVPSPFSNFGKIDIAAPGRDTFSAVPRPRLYGTMTGTSMAAAHVAGCAALWAESSPRLRGMNLWKKLQTSAKPLHFPPSKVGRGLVQAP